MISAVSMRPECDRQFRQAGRKIWDMWLPTREVEEALVFRDSSIILTLITQDEEISLPLMSKEDAAFRILDKILSLMQDSVC